MSVLYCYTKTHPQQILMYILFWFILCGVMEWKTFKKNNWILFLWKSMVMAVFAGCLSLFLYVALANRFQFDKLVYRLELFWSYRAAFVQNVLYLRRLIFWNIVAFIPMGHALNLLLGKYRSWWKTSLIVFAISLSVELIQLFGRIGLFEFDDIFNNVLGGLLGYGVAWLTNVINKHIDYTQ